MAYLWNSILETGNKEIDEQHKQLFIALNDLNDAYWQGKGSDEVSGILDFLKEYTINHFKDEEIIMRDYKYPQYSMHRMCHEDFKITVEDFSRQLRKEGPSEELIVKLTTTLGDWLTTHIRIDDARMAEFIESNGYVDI